jgi:uncharacterized phage protein gp47/JayE
MAYWDYNEILSRMLIAAQQAEPECDTREGSLIYTACAPMAAELAQAYIAANLLLENTFADVATRDYLIRRAAERGVTPYPAVAAQYVCEWDYEEDKGPQPDEIFYTVDGVAFIVFSVDTLNKQCVITCMSKGVIGNGKFGQLVPQVANQAFVSMSIVETLVVGEDEESTEHLRRRYFQELETLAFGGNIADYVNITNNIDGVGATKVVPTWNGGGTVKVIIADAALQPPSSFIIERVQTALDPETNQGSGIGMAPIGHTVTVVGASSETINVSAHFLYLPGYSFENLGEQLQGKLNGYLNTCNINWEADETIVIREASLISAFLDVVGVIDVQNVAINDVEGNYTLQHDTLAAYGMLIPIGE